MENNSSDSRCAKTKCSTRKGLFRSWIWCILLKCFISLPCIFSKCLGVDITVAVYPQGDITVRYGDPLEIFCVGENYLADDLEFTVDGKQVESDIVNETTRRLYYEKPAKQVITYYCKNKKTNKKCVNRVLVDSPPENITTFSCLSKNLDILNCSWHEGHTFSKINYSLTFIINGNPVRPCTVEKFDKTRYCTWNTSSKPRYRQLEEEFYFNLQSCNGFGCIEQNITVDHFSIVKPDPPSKLKVLYNGTHSVVLQWVVPNNVKDLLPCGVDHKIEYQIAKIDNTAYFHSVDASFLPPNNKTYRFQLNNLPYAHMQYEVRIYIKSKKAVRDEFWSEYNYISFYTDSERPGRPPEMIAGGFDQATYSKNRIIYVYWKQLEEYEEAGANFTYKVVVSQGNKSETLLADKNKSLSYVYLDDAPLEAMQVSVWSYNMKGQSVNNSHMYIPSVWDTRNLDVTSFTKLAYENGTYELSWVGIDSIDNYTLFWCQHNATKICAGRLNFTILESYKNNHVIHLPGDYRYQFAISANKGSKTSGMTWAKCEISKVGMAMYGFNVHLKYDAPGKSFVKLRWSMDCALQDGIITGYNITYCPVIQTSSLCDATVGNQSIFISDSAKMEVNITDLLPFRTYQFTIALNTTYGLKTIENATAVITTSEDTPTKPRNITITDVKSNSLNISWDPPLHRNGIIGKYVIYNFGQEFYVHNVSGTDTSRSYVTLTGLQGFTNYSWTIQACNIPIGLCSQVGPNEGIFVRTRIGAPSRLKAPTIRNNPDLLKWDKPEIPGGTVDFYQVRRIKDDMEPEIMNSTDLTLSVTHCEGGIMSETYQVRAVNCDEDPDHGALADKENVNLTRSNVSNVYYGEWSEPSTVACRSRDGLAVTFILMIVFAIIGLVYGTIKLYKRYKKMEDIKPVLPIGLGTPEKDSKYTFGSWNPSNKDDKPSSDEALLLPDKTTVSSTDTKQKTNDNCAASDHTDSTALSDSSREPVDRQVSTSDDGSNSSLQLEGEPIKDDETNQNQEMDSSTDIESFRENPSYYVDNSFKKNPTSGYVQPVVKPTTGYVQSAPAPHLSISQIPSTQPASSSYVMAGLSPPVFNSETSAPCAPSQLPPSSGYVRPEETQPKSVLTFPKLVTSPSKLLGPESLPSMPTLPTSVTPSADSSYIQLQSLDAIPSLKSSVRNTVPLKPSASNGYVSPEDVVINKHLNNMLYAGQLAEESAVLDPTMSPDAYCRFSWSTDPANDNLHSLLADSRTINTNKN
ncbi:Cytokine receptor [Papilio xuthus]|uniref:Cytokine receptor n=1 Tax=Papilio xuthus TaxID=66420 RepID=A0A194QCC0_PAPXU|nr:Cytokine receptor [Papilio xuthus]